MYPSLLDRSPDIAEQTRVLNGHPRCKLRIYPRFLPQVQRKHETSPQWDRRSDSPALHAEQFQVPNQTRKETWFAYGTAESPQEHPHKSRMTLMSPKECEIVRCIPNQLKMMPDSPLLDIDQSYVPHHTRQVAFLTWDTRLKSKGTPISAEELEESSMDAITSRGESRLPGFYWIGRTTFHKHLKNTLPSAICVWEGPWVFCLN